jgi:glycosyltransferase involved in cell wall biosynthesis
MIVMRTQISIIIPCYFEATLEDTLKSVIDQDYQDWEVIIVNDGSIDTTEEIALKWIVILDLDIFQKKMKD